MTVTPDEGAAGPALPERAQRKLATVLFADLVGSTALGASQDAERTRALLDRFYDAMAEEVARAGGTVEKFAGDAVMAAFGAPAAREDHVERALHAALAMQRRLVELGGQLSLRIGVNTGEVVVGPAREGSSFVTGDPVNVAARLEQIAEPGDVLVGERTAALAAGAFEFGPPVAVHAKGKAEPVPCRRLVRALSLMRPRGAPGLPSVFVGRERELATLQRAFERAPASRNPELVTIMGDAGVGKTRLVRELWRWLGQESPEALRRTGRCPAYGHGVTYAPIADMLKEQFGVLDSDSPGRILEALGDRAILGLALGLDVGGDLHPIVARDRLHDAWLGFVEELAAERPLALLVEDLHWAEEPLLDLLERTVLDVSGPVLLLGTARPELLERSPTWGRGRAASEWIWLEPLAADAAKQLAEELVGRDVPSAVRDVLAQAEGNPFFLEELLATLIERGVLERTNAWNVSALPAEAAIPDSVQALLAARVDLLPPQERAALQAAAVIGRSFWPSAVGELLGGIEPDFRLLEQRDFVRRRPGSSLAEEREFVFKHALTREVAYGSLTRRDRARLHAAFAHWLERRGGRDEDAALLALHYAEAVRPEDADLAWADEPGRHAELQPTAVAWLRRAASLAAGRYEVEEALALLDSALALAADDRERVEILRELGRTHMLRYDPQSFRSEMERALELGPEPSVAADIYAELAYVALARPYMWREPPVTELGERWLTRALELAQPGTAARATALLAQALSDPDSAAEAAAEAYELGHALGEPKFVVYACEAQTLAATQRGRYEAACDWVDRAFAVVPDLSDPGYELHQYWNAGFVYARAGRLHEARRFAAVCEELASSLTAHDEVHAVGLLALLESLFGNWELLAGLASRAEAASAANEDFPCQFNWRTLVVCGLALAHAGEERDARRLEELGRSNAIVAGPPEREPALLRLALLRGDLESAEAILEGLPPVGNPWSVDSAAARLDALAALGDSQRAEREAAPFVEAQSYTRPFALRALGLMRGDDALVAEAAAGFEAMGLGWRAEETRALGSGRARGAPRR